jgi:hypothetical protein
VAQTQGRSFVDYVAPGHDLHVPVQAPHDCSDEPGALLSLAVVAEDGAGVVPADEYCVDAQGGVGAAEGAVLHAAEIGHDAEGCSVRSDDLAPE